MLALSRKPGEAIIIGDNIRVQVVSLAGGKVRLGIEAPREVTVLREELFEPMSGDGQLIFGDEEKCRS